MIFFFTVNVGGFKLDDLRVRAADENFDQSVLVCADALHGVVE